MVVVAWRLRGAIKLRGLVKWCRDIVKKVNGRKPSKKLRCEKLLLSRLGFEQDVVVASRVAAKSMIRVVSGGCPALFRLPLLNKKLLRHASPGEPRLLEIGLQDGKTRTESGGTTCLTLLA